MVALKTLDLGNGFKKVSDLVNVGEKVLIARPHNQNLVVLSEDEYNQLEKARRNAEYLTMIYESRRQLAEGKTYTFSIDELTEMEDMTVAEMQAYAEAHKDF